MIKLNKNESVDFLNKPNINFNSSLEKKRNSSIDVKKKYIPKDWMNKSENKNGPATSMKVIQNIYNQGQHKKIPDYSKQLLGN